MITAKFYSSNTTTAYGLTQWDYGQELALECQGVEIADGTEINFYQGKLSSVSYLKNNKVMIPDLMLQRAIEITAYVYIRQKSSGETILTILLPVGVRPRPENYVLPEHEDYKRLLPAGGESGQVLRKSAAVDYSAAWSEAADNIDLTDGVLQLMSGSRRIGERVRITAGTGREIELKNDGAAIVWRYTDSNDWTFLVSLEELKGPPGVTPDFEIRDGHLIVIYPV